MTKRVFAKYKAEKIDVTPVAQNNPKRRQRHNKRLDEQKTKEMEVKIIDDEKKAENNGRSRSYQTANHI